MFISCNHEINLCNIFQGPNEITCNKQETIMNISGLLNLVQTGVETLTHPFNSSLSEFFLFSFNKPGVKGLLQHYPLRPVCIHCHLTSTKSEQRASINNSVTEAFATAASYGLCLTPYTKFVAGWPWSTWNLLSLVFVIRLQAPKLPGSESRIWYTSYCSHQHGSWGFSLPWQKAILQMKNQLFDVGVVWFCVRKNISAPILLEPRGFNSSPNLISSLT